MDASNENIKETSKVRIPDRLFFRIGEVADLLSVKAYVLRYWETEFPFLSPKKGHNGQRVYRKSDVEGLLLIKHLLYEKRFSIEGARKKINELRKEGDLKKYKKEEVLQKSDLKLPEEDWKTIQSLTKELKKIADHPITDIFNSAPTIK